MFPPLSTSSSIVCAIPAFSSSPSDEMPPLPETTRSERASAVSVDRVGRERALPALDLDHEVVAGLGRRAALAGADRQRSPFVGDRSVASSVDGLRVEPALDARAAARRSRGRRARCRRSCARPRRRRTRRPPTSASSAAVSSADAGEQLRLRADLARSRWRSPSGTPSDGLVLKPWPEPKRFSSAGTTLTSSARYAELGGDELGVPALVAVGLGRQAQHHLAGRMDAQEHRAVGLVSHSPVPFSSGGRSARCGPRGHRTPTAARPPSCGGTTGRSQPG